MNHPTIYQFNDEIGDHDNTNKEIYWIKPGNLNISRTFGDFHLKQDNDGPYISEPDIKQVDLNENVDFIMLCCDGVFDRLTTKETIETAWK